MLNGELDSITTPAEGARVAEQFPDATQVVVPNSFHVTALGDTDGCASAPVRRFVLDPGGAIPRDPCADVPPVDAMGCSRRGSPTSGGAAPCTRPSPT